jgi:hypothetical protein
MHLAVLLLSQRFAFACSHEDELLFACLNLPAVQFSNAMIFECGRTD